MVVQAQQSIEIAENNGSPLSLTVALHGLGRALLASGNPGASVLGGDVWYSAAA